MIMIDPKSDVEMSDYGKIPHLMHPVVTDMKKAEAILAWAVDKMEERYDLLQPRRVRNIAELQRTRHEEIHAPRQPDDDEERERIPAADAVHRHRHRRDVGDLMMQMKKEVEGHIIRLAQKSRAAGIHLVLATQKPTVDVITGPHQVEPAGAHLLQGGEPDRTAGSCSTRWAPTNCSARATCCSCRRARAILVRAQGTYASDEEISEIVEHPGIASRATRRS